MLLKKANVYLGLLILYSFFIGSTDARRGRTRSRTKSKVIYNFIKKIKNVNISE